MTLFAGWRQLFNDISLRFCRITVLKKEHTTRRKDDSIDMGVYGVWSYAYPAIGVNRLQMKTPKNGGFSLISPFVLVGLRF